MDNEPKDDLAFLEVPQVLDSTAMATLQEKLSRLKDLRDEIETKETELKALKSMEMKQSREDVPGFMLQFGINKLSLEDGTEVSIKEDIAMSVPKTDPVKRKLVFGFLLEHGGGGLIKDKVTIESPSLSIIKQLEEKEMAYTRSQDVNTASLKALVRGLLGLKKNTVATLNVGDIPKELNVYVYRDTKLKGVK